VIAFDEVFTTVLLGRRVFEVVVALGFVEEIIEILEKFRAEMETTFYVLENEI